MHGNDSDVVEDIIASPSSSTPISLSSPGTPGTTHRTPATPLPKLLFSNKHRLLKTRLAPLRRVQRDLEAQLGTGAEEPLPALAGAAMTEAAPFAEASSSFESGSAAAGLGVMGPAGAITLAGGITPCFVPPSRRGPQEFYVRSSTGWKAALERLRPLGSSDAKIRGLARWMTRRASLRGAERTLGRCGKMR